MGVTDKFINIVLSIASFIKKILYYSAWIMVALFAFVLVLSIIDAKLTFHDEIISFSQNVLLIFGAIATWIVKDFLVNPFNPDIYNTFFTKIIVNVYFTLGGVLYDLITASFQYLFFLLNSIVYPVTNTSVYEIPKLTLWNSSVAFQFSLKTGTVYFGVDNVFGIYVKIVFTIAGGNAGNSVGGATDSVIRQFYNINGVSNVGFLSFSPSFKFNYELKDTLTIDIPQVIVDAINTLITELNNLINLVNSILNLSTPKLCTPEVLGQSVCTPTVSVRSLAETAGIDISIPTVPSVSTSFSYTFDYILAFPDSGSFFASLSLGDTLQSKLTTKKTPIWGQIIQDIANNG